MCHIHIPILGPDILGYFRSATEAYLVLNVHSVTTQSFSGLNSLQMLRVILYCDFPTTGRVKSPTAVRICGSAPCLSTLRPRQQWGLHLASAVGRAPPGLGFSVPPPGP